MRHIMIDLETLDVRPTALVLSIGAVEFSPDGIGVTFYAVLQTAAQEAAGRTIRADTVLWWMQQSEEARRAIFAPDIFTPVSPITALSNLADFMSNPDGVWGNGADFDNVILSSLYEAFYVPRPWSYKATRCYRTLNALCGPRNKPKRTGVYHNALDDARYQAQCAIEMLNAHDLWRA